MRHLPTIIYVLILSFGYSIFAQTDNLPENLNLSFNGTFVTKKENNSYRNLSENGVFGVTYDIGKVTDEQRQILNFKLYENDVLKYTIHQLPGSDVYVSNSGYITTMNMNFHYKQELTVIVFNKLGQQVHKRSYQYASLFGFSPSGNKFVVGNDDFLEIIDLNTNQHKKVAPASKFAFSMDESILATAMEEEIIIYQDYQVQQLINTGLFYPRGLVVLNNNSVAVVGKKYLKLYTNNGQLVNKNMLSTHLSYRDLKIWNEKLLAGVHYKYNGSSKGILQTFDADGILKETNEISAKNYQTFEKSPKLKSTNSIDPIPWPFFPFDTIHKVWNHYEQHMGDGSGDWSYLHQGLDIEVPVNEPTYAVEEGWVKLVLTLGGAIYWRVAVSPVQSSGYSDGWLYAHLVESSIQVDVGDYVQLHDYLGDIIYWSDDWGHIHFVNIKDQGDIWYYDDDEWGINFNPLLALTPNYEEVPPVIENFSSSSKFGFYTNETTNYLDPNDLSGNVDIVTKISEYHGTSEWEQPAYKSYYWLNKLPENTNVFPKTLGQILNHPYPFYSGANYYPYADIIYKKDYNHPSPPWMNWDRDYYQILTNNNGDSIIELSEAQLAFPTADYPDGDYRLFVEAWDEAGNIALDSMDITFDNFNTGIKNLNSSDIVDIKCFPNPATDYVVFEFSVLSSVFWVIENKQIRISDAIGNQVALLKVKNGNDKVIWNTQKINPGVYFYDLELNGTIQAGKLIISR